MNASVAIQDQVKTIVSALIIISCTCIAFVCHVYMKFLFKIKYSTFFSLIVLEKYRILGWNIGNIAKPWKHRNIGSLDTLEPHWHIGYQ